jgi:perosamine synthetase
LTTKISARIPVAGPWVTEREIRYVTDAAANDWYGQAGESLRRFERAFAERLGAKHAIGLPHCTAGLHLGLLAFGVGPGDEVIVPDVTWVATAEPIYYVGARPVFADMDPVTWCVTAESIERCITERTKAIIVVDLYGAIPDMDSIRDLANRKGIPILEDAAEAIGADIGGRQAGTFGDIAAFSFHGSKTLTTGEGGMLVTDSTQHYDRCLFLRDHGRPPGSARFFVSTEVGYRYKMSGLQAAFGLAQLERLDELMARKRAIFSWYEQRLHDLPGVTLNYEAPGTHNAYWMVTIVVDRAYGLNQREMMAHFDGYEIETRPFFHPLSSLQAFAQAPDAAEARIRNVHSYDISRRGLNLPSALLLDEGQIDRVCAAVRDLLNRPDRSLGTR